MVQAHERQPKIESDDLQPDWRIKSFKATWQEGTLTAYAYLDPIDDQPERGYVLNCTYSHKQPSRRLSDRQIDAGTTLTSRVRDFMLEQMVRAGWVSIGMEKKGVEQLTKSLNYAILISTLMRLFAHLSLVLSDKPLSYIGRGLRLRLPATSLRACPRDAGRKMVISCSVLSCERRV